MTNVDVVFRYGQAPGEPEMRALDNLRKVYGIRRILFREQERTVRDAGLRVSSLCRGGFLTAEGTGPASCRPGGPPPPGTCRPRSRC